MLDKNRLMEKSTLRSGMKGSHLPFDDSSLDRQEVEITKMMLNEIDSPRIKDNSMQL
jgi:hypothetical protein